MKKLENLLGSHGIEYYAVTENELIFIAPYSPLAYPDDCYTIDGYYFISHSVYRRANEIIAELNAWGSEARRYEGNLRGLALSAGLAKILANGFAACDEYGTYMFICAVSIPNAREKLKDFCGAFSRLPTLSASCDGCGKCLKACPTGAAGNAERMSVCLRAIQMTAYKGLTKEQEVHLSKLENRLLGCNACQSVCKVNGNVHPLPAPSDIVDILRKDKIFSAISDKNALSILADKIGANIAVKNKLLPIVQILEQHGAGDGIRDCRSEFTV